MRIFDYLEMLKLFDSLVESERTGSPSEFAAHLNISRSTLYEMVDELRSRGIDIAYSRTKRTFYYRIPTVGTMKLVIGSYLTEMSESEMQKIDAGTQISPSVLFPGRNNLIFASGNRNFLGFSITL